MDGLDRMLVQEFNRQAAAAFHSLVLLQQELVPRNQFLSYSKA